MKWKKIIFSFIDINFIWIASKAGHEDAVLRIIFDVKMLLIPKQLANAFNIQITGKDGNWLIGKSPLT